MRCNLHLKMCYVFTAKQNSNAIKTRVSQPASVLPNNPIGPLVTASCSDLGFTSTRPLFLVRGKSSSFVGELTSMSKQWAASKSRGWWECQPMKSGGEWDESGATGWAAACYCPLRCALIPRSFPSVTEPEDRSATVGCGVWMSPGRPGGQGMRSGGGYWRVVARNN